MIYLTRTFKIIGDPEKAFAIGAEMVKHMKNFDEVKDVQILWNVNGPQDQVHLVGTFDSMAAEEQFASKAMEDPKYVELIKKTAGLLWWPVDNFYRVVSLP